MKTKEIRKNLIEALEKATFDTARFGFIQHQLDYDCKNETRLFRETWLIPPILEALRLVDPCKYCNEGRIYLDVFEHHPERGVVTSKECWHCKGTSIRAGLPFDPYERSRHAVEEAHKLRETQNHHIQEVIPCDK